MFSAATGSYEGGDRARTGENTAWIVVFDGGAGDKGVTHGLPSPTASYSSPTQQDKRDFEVELVR